VCPALSYVASGKLQQLLLLEAAAAAEEEEREEEVGVGGEGAGEGGVGGGGGGSEGGGGGGGGGGELSKKALAPKIAFLREKAARERGDNARLSRRAAPVRYGDLLQLRHVSTGAFLCFATGSTVSSAGAGSEPLPEREKREGDNFLSDPTEFY
jgi:hypothetical protein